MNELNPKEYFDYLKEKRVKTSDADLNAFYDSCILLLNKYEATGQKAALKKLIFQIETVEKERNIIQLGIDTFVYKDEIENYIDKVATNVVKIIELENYEREIPDELLPVIANTKEIFDRFYVVFTDYTGKAEKQVEKKRREKDPILFGTFQNQKERVICERFYYLGDWVDKYCDLTLDKMINEVKCHEHKDIEIKIKTPTQINELKEQLNQLEENNGLFKVNKKKEKNIILRVKEIFKNEK